MFQSFFPRPKIFFLSVVAWFFVTLAIWYGFADGFAAQLSLMREAWPTVEGERPPFLNPDKVWLYQYIILVTILFCIFWFFIDRTRWYSWAVCGSAIILLVTYFQVQVGVWFNNIYGELFDLVQQSLTTPGSVEASEFYDKMRTIVFVLIPNILTLVFFSFYVSHYVFRWRTAMNDYYMSHWSNLRTIEGAAQRVQEDTMRFASIVEGLGSQFVSAIMTLIAFLPLLWSLSAQVTELPHYRCHQRLTGVSGVDFSLFSELYCWQRWVTVCQGLEFNNQKVEAAYRKELVYGEDDEERCQPPTIKELFS